MAEVTGGSAAAPRIDHYRLERRLAVGGMAEIYLAVDERTDRTVAFKRILPQIASDPDFLNRFFHEIRIQISLKHRNVVELLDCSPGASKAYIVMEYVDGGSISTLLEKVGKLPWDLALFVAEEALRGLGAAHRKGIVHRDVKPQNLMWTKDGAVKIADFGISQAEHLTRLTVTGTVVGTPSYMSPEQAKGEPLDPRSDLFSIGTVLYGLLTGLNPFTSDSVAATLRRVVDVDADPPSLVDPTLPPAVDRVLRKLHAKARDGRYASADEAGESIRAVMAAEGVVRPVEAFREFVADPVAFVGKRRRAEAEEGSKRAESLLADRSAPPEEALWAAYRTMAVAPDDVRAQTLFKTAAARVGQREKPVDNAKIRELEEQLRKDPENVAVLLQLAKLYRLERDFVNVMRFFRKLQSLSPADAYTQNQIAALVVSPTTGAPRVPAVERSSARSRVPAPPPPAPPSGLSRGGWAAAIAGGVAVVALGVWWMNGPGARLTQAGEEDKRRAAALLKLLSGGDAPVAVPGAGTSRPAPDEALQKVLEKGALLEREGGPARALAYYREALGRLASGQRGVLLLAIADVALKAGDRAGALEALDEAAGLGGGVSRTARLRKGELLEEAGDAGAARTLYEEMARGSDEPARWTATLRLALLADREGDTERALLLYEEILARAPGSPEANPSRLGAAALYRSQGRTEDAQRLYEEVARNAPSGSDFAKSAEEGLKTLE